MDDLLAGGLVILVVMLIALIAVEHRCYLKRKKKHDNGEFIKFL